MIRTILRKGKCLDDKELCLEEEEKEGKGTQKEKVGFKWPEISLVGIACLATFVAGVIA